MRVRNRIDIEEEMLEVDENAGEYQGDEEVSTFKLTSTLLQYMSRTWRIYFRINIKLPSRKPASIQVQSSPKCYWYSEQYSRKSKICIHKIWWKVSIFVFWWKYVDLQVTSAEHFSLKIPSEVSRCFEVRANFNVKTKYFDSFLISFTVDRFRFCGVDDSCVTKIK